MESVPEPEDSSPVLTWILGTSGVSHGSHSSSRVEICTWVFHPSCSSSVKLPFAWITNQHIALQLPLLGGHSTGYTGQLPEKLKHLLISGPHFPRVLFNWLRDGAQALASKKTNKQNPCLSCDLNMQPRWRTL